MYMVMFVLGNPCHLDSVLEAWQALGLDGVTIVESTGIHRRRLRREGLHLRFDYGQLEQRCEEGSYTLFAIVRGDELVHKAVAAAEGVVGDLSSPHSGVFAAWPLAVVRGVPKGLEGTEAG